MKSLILKDLYNIGHNTKSMLFILAVFAVAFIPTSGVGAYFHLRHLMQYDDRNHFSFDDNSKWARYAMIMPISKRFSDWKVYCFSNLCAIGSVFGLAVGLVGGGIAGKITFSPAAIVELLF